MTGDERQLRVGELTVDDMDVRAADSACADFEKQLTGPW